MTYDQERFWRDAQVFLDRMEELQRRALRATRFAFAWTVAALALSLASLAIRLWP